MLTKTKHRNHSLNKDLAKIKAIMYNGAYDIKDSATDILADSIDIAMKKSNKLSHQITRYAYHKPMKFVGIGFISGLFLSLFLRRR